MNLYEKCKYFTFFFIKIKNVDILHILKYSSIFFITSTNEEESVKRTIII